MPSLTCWKKFFMGTPGAPTQPEQLDEPLWTCRELTFAIKRLKNNKATDECGLVAEVLRCVPADCLNSLLQIMNEILHKGVVPSSWRKTFFQMLPKTHRARVPADFRPIANLRLLYKVFAYLVLGRIEATLEQHQPEEQHGFTVIDKTLLANVPLWIVSLDLSKAFDRVSWDSLWGRLLRHGVSEHLVWALRLIYWEQKGQIVTKQDTSWEFDIKAGVRQGCVLNPRLFSCVLEVALKKWREQLQDGGLDLGDGGIPLLDLRFADDILLFATSSVEAARMVDALVTWLKKVGLALNASKLRFKQRKRSQAKQWQLKTVWKWKFWMRLGRANGLDACYQRGTLATEKLTWTSVCRLHQRPSTQTNGFCVTKMFPWSLASDSLILWWLRWSVLELVNANCTNRNFENLMCIAVNFYVKSWAHQETLIGLNRGTPFCTSETNVLWNKWPSARKKERRKKKKMQLNSFEFWSPVWKTRSTPKTEWTHPRPRCWRPPTPSRVPKHSPTLRTNNSHSM